MNYPKNRIALQFGAVLMNASMVKVSIHATSHFQMTTTVPTNGAYQEDVVKIPDKIQADYQKHGKVPSPFRSTKMYPGWKVRMKKQEGNKQLRSQEI